MLGQDNIIFSSEHRLYPLFFTSYVPFNSTNNDCPTSPPWIRILSVRNIIIQQKTISVKTITFIPLLIVDLKIDTEQCRHS